MKKVEMIICLGSLYSRYQTKTEVKDATEEFYKRFGRYSQNVFTWVLEQYHENYFPKTYDIESLISRIIDEQQRIIDDPRNTYYRKVSEDAGKRREKKINNAHRIINALTIQNIKMLKAN